MTKFYENFVFAASVFVFCAGLFSAVPALAATSYTMICADSGIWTSGGTFSCTGTDVLNFTAGTNAHLESSPSNYHLTDNTTYYVSGTYSGTGNIAIGVGGDNVGSSYYTASASFSDVPLTYPNGNTANTGTLQFYDGSGAVCNGVGCSFTGSLTTVCITDTIGGCGTPTPPQSNGSFDPFGTTTSYTVITNPNQDFFNGMMLFMSGLFLILWLFKGRK